MAEQEQPPAQSLDVTAVPRNLVRHEPREGVQRGLGGTGETADGGERFRRGHTGSVATTRECVDWFRDGGAVPVSRLVFVRHGRSRHAELGILAGRAGCPGLTEQGVAQAREVATELLDRYGLPDAVETSPVRRARQTAELIVDTLRIGVPPVQDDRLTEPDPGLADGMTHAESAARFGSFDPRSEPDRPTAPGGESWNRFLARIEHYVEAQDSRPGEHRWVVTHAGFMVWLVRHLSGATGSALWLDPGNCSSLVFEVDEGRWTLAAYQPFKSPERSSTQSDQPS